MRLSSFRPILVFLFSLVLIASYTTVKAQSVERPSDPPPQAAASASKSNAEIPRSISSRSVKSFSDDELNAIFEKVPSQYSKDPVLFNNLGAEFFERKMFDKAETAILRAIALNNHPAFLINLSVVYDTEGRMPDAIAYAQRAVSQAPKYVRGRTQLCELLLVAGRSPDAVICYNELAKITVLDDYSKTLTAVAHQRVGNQDKVISMLSPLVRGPNPTSLMLNTLGYAYYVKKSFSKAIDAFRQAVSIRPDDPAVRYNLAVALEAVHDHGGALMQYSLMKSKHPKLADQLYRGLNRGKVLYVDEAEASKKP